MSKLLTTALAGGLLALASAPAGAARFHDPALQASPALVEQAACTMRRERVERPNGRVVFRTVRRCGPGIGPGPRFGDRCRMVRARVERPNGTVVFRTTRRCG